ncbi:MAG: ferredoxin--NADP reductase [Chloroflexota bacterium]|nr:ferredoxin--NADP reductase [Chloroflexota bacterium]
MPGPERGATPSYDATIADRVDLTDTIAAFRIRPDGPVMPFTPGQYVTIGRVGADGRLVQRPYSVASSARRTEAGYELFIRLVRAGALTPLLFATKVGDRVTLKRPKGRFTLRPDDQRTHIFIATGCGLAPFLSMLRTLDDDAAPRKVIVLHGVSYADELGYRSELERWAADPRWGLRYVPTVSRPREPRNAGWTGRTGRAETVLGPLLDELRLPPAESVAYICGNPEMTVTAEEILRGHGFDAGSIHKELYWPLGSGRSSGAA